ncbi:hypothetical protein BJ684DRAFT_8212, partial [Piptocephalis cylindrospora]
GFRGLRNLGSTCFLSSVTQMFLHNPLMRSYFLSGGHAGAGAEQCSVRERKGACFSCEMDALFAQIWGGNRRRLTKAEEAEAENHVADGLDSGPLSPTSLAGYAQQDAHEYFITALNMLHSSTSGCREDGRCTCIVHTLFSGVLGSQIRCDRCENATLTLDPILDLSLDIHPEDQEGEGSPNPLLALGDCIDRYTREERLKGMNYTCGKCGYASKEVSKQMSIHRLPTVLHIQLKRFKHGYHGGEKLESPVSLPHVIDMTPYTTDGINARRRGGRMYNRYRLFGLVCHQGKMDTGHYTAYIIIRGQWYHFDDHMVRSASEAEVSKANGYVLPVRREEGKDIKMNQI